MWPVFFLSGRLCHPLFVSSVLSCRDDVSCRDPLWSIVLNTQWTLSIWKLKPLVLENILEGYFFENLLSYFVSVFLSGDFSVPYNEFLGQGSNFLIHAPPPPTNLYFHFLLYSERVFSNLPSKSLFLPFLLLYFKIPRQLIPFYLFIFWFWLSLLYSILFFFHEFTIFCAFCILSLYLIFRDSLDVWWLPPLSPFFLHNCDHWADLPTLIFLIF